MNYAKSYSINTHISAVTELKQIQEIITHLLNLGFYCNWKKFTSGTQPHFFFVMIKRLGGYTVKYLVHSAEPSPWLHCLWLEINHTKARINAAATSIPEKAAKFQDLVNSKLRDCSDLEAKECWDQIRDTTLAAAIQAFGKTKTRSQDWFDANIITLQPLIEAKRDLLLEHRKNPTPETLAA